ncbi:beta-lactamase hydrolase domain-containing protein [Sphingomonas sp. MMS24-JH45]
MARNPAQPAGDDIRAAAEGAGLSYAAISVTHAGFSHPQVAAMIDAVQQADGPVLAFCRSGTRSCYLWALAGAGSCRGGGRADRTRRRWRGTTSPTCAR